MNAHEIADILKNIVPGRKVVGDENMYRTYHTLDGGCKREGN